MCGWAGAWRSPSFGKASFAEGACDGPGAGRQGRGGEDGEDRVHVGGTRSSSALQVFDSGSSVSTMLVGVEAGVQGELARFADVQDQEVRQAVTKQ